METQIGDLPEAILQTVFAAVGDTRARNAMALVCRRWRDAERATRTALALRGGARDLFLAPSCFHSVTDLDLSRLSPWGSDLPVPELVARRLGQAFPSVTSLTVYARGSAVGEALVREWPRLRRVRLLRWHRRPDSEVGEELGGMLKMCSTLVELDLSSFYCWTEDVATAVEGWRGAAGLARLDLMGLSSDQGFGAKELLAISAACPNLVQLRACCLFNSRLVGAVGEDVLLGLAGNCPRLAVLHLLDPGSTEEEEEEEGGPSRGGLEEMFARLPRMEDLALEMHAPVMESGPALEVMGRRCPRLRALRLGRFQGVCRGVGLHLDGLSVCGGLRRLSLKGVADLADVALAAIARGCSRLGELELHACPQITATGVLRLTEACQGTLRRVSLSRCHCLTTARVLRALEPVRDRLEGLHIDCIWDPPEDDENDDDSDDDEDEDKGRKRRRVSCEWESLRELSVWVGMGETLCPLAEMGLESCPRLEEMNIKVEGDCRQCPRPGPRSSLGLGMLAQYPRLRKMKLDCGDAHGYALTAPMGHMDLSLWERFYLWGIGALDGLEELDYWPPQDRDMNQRGLSLPAAGQLAQCSALRKLFIHGTAYEHFMQFLLRIPSLRDVQLREDYYPAPDGDASSETRFDSCSRFEAALNRRFIPD